FFFEWCHQEESYFDISIDSQSFILFQIGKSTRFSTRLFFIVLLAISRVAFAKLLKRYGISKLSLNFVTVVTVAEITKTIEHEILQ
ncbi:MAG: hypothetical protein KA172_10140, partial [Paludibacter sp.]|nr:hypothetical protein [Paludibacter sp.]